MINSDLWINANHLRFRCIRQGCEMRRLNLSFKRKTKRQEGKERRFRRKKLKT